MLLLENPILTQIHQDLEDSIKNFKTLSIIHLTVSEDIFYRLVCFRTKNKTLDYLNEEYAGSAEARGVKLLILKIEFGLIKIQEGENVKDNSTKVINMVNQIRLLGMDCKDQKATKKMMINLSERFEPKFSVIEEISDLEKPLIVELISKLQVQ